ncbi:hypothetical protein RFI_27106, partial [Reticulomyxa filosa]
MSKTSEHSFEQKLKKHSQQYQGWTTTEEGEKQRLSTETSKKYESCVIKRNARVSDEYSILAIWNEPLSPLNYLELNTSKPISAIQQAIEAALKAMEDKDMIDYIINEARDSIHGRVFGRNGSCSFVISLARILIPPNTTATTITAASAIGDDVDTNSNANTVKNDGDSNDDNVVESTQRWKSVMDIRRMNGDGFVFQQFFECFARQMKKVQVVVVAAAAAANAHGSI